MKKLSCFKSYDIRGLVPDDLNLEMAYLIGEAYAKIMRPKKIVIGYDIRLYSPDFASSIIEALIDNNIDVVNIGLCGSEEVYFHTFSRVSEGVDGGIMITASHNPKGYNGIKMVKKNSVPMTGDGDLKDIHDYVFNLYNKQNSTKKTRPLNLGSEIIDTDKSQYIQHILQYIDRKKLKPLKIVVNPGNGSAGDVIKLLEKYTPFEFVYLNESPDGNFPNGVPNPMIDKNRTVTSECVKKHGADFGVAWDGDFDRCFLFDEKGDFIEAYYIVGLLAKCFLEKSKNETIIYDPRLTWNTIDIAASYDCRAVLSKSGHSYIKKKMREKNAVYGGEMSGHHYFRDFAYCDSGMIPWLLIAELIGNLGVTLSSLVAKSIDKYPCSGEINYRVKNADKVIGGVVEHFKNEGGIIDYSDGVSVEFADWRFNLRSSNTEPLIRLNLETRAKNASIPQRVRELESIINGLNV